MALPLIDKFDILAVSGLKAMTIYDITCGYKQSPLSGRLKMKRTLSVSLIGCGLAAGLLLMLGSGHASVKSTAAVTFTKDVAPIIQKNCQVCHRPGEIAPMSFMSYKEVRPWARSIREKVVTREMPPWFADPKHTEFSNDCRLSQKEIDTI